MSSKANEIVKFTKKVLTSIPSNIPKDSITVQKLSDGYKLKVSHEMNVKDERGSIQSSYAMETEEHFGAKVRDVKGDFNKNGIYEINIAFEENE